MMGIRSAPARMQDGRARVTSQCGAGLHPTFDRPPQRYQGARRIHPLAAIAILLGLSGSAGADESSVAESASTAHEKLFSEQRYPSAATCGNCHPKQFREWSVSAHAYAQLSPVFNAMHGKIVRLTNGTNGDFCIRCHTQVGMNFEEPIFESNLRRHPTSREGVTCVVCHRAPQRFGKASGRLPLSEGDIFAVVDGPTGNKNLSAAKTEGLVDPNPPPSGGAPTGRSVHRDAVHFEFLTESGFCGACHDVNLFNGFRLEEAFSEFKTSPAANQNVSCQDCHMATQPGQKSDYEVGPAALVGSTKTPDRKLTNHMFAGPDYSIVHPGVFPHNIRAGKLATLEEWLQFDEKAGWGDADAEDALPDGFVFPKVWADDDKRYDARDVLEDNKKLLEEIGRQRLQILRVGYVLGDVELKRADARGMDFRIQVRNGTTGHGVPTGFDAERLVFLQVTVRDAEGNPVFQSGDRDPNGDLRDAHSAYVHDGRLEPDRYLFSLQSKFLTRNLRGGEREEVLSVNTSVDSLPYIRPATNSTFLLGRPTGARKHKQNIEPGGHRWARYRVGAEALRGHRGPFTANVKLIAQMVPVNLVHEIMDVGFDYGMTPRQVADAVVAGALVLHERDEVLGSTPAAKSESR